MGNVISLRVTPKRSEGTLGIGGWKIGKQDRKIVEYPIGSTSQQINDYVQG
jgi:hypothetical protein